MAEKFPYLARQMNGPIARSFGYGFDSVYEKDAEFIKFLSRFSVDTLYGKWLDQLGVVLGVLRPYLTIPTVEETFTFDSLAFRLDPDMHGFSSEPSVERDDKLVTRSNGGMLDNIIREVTDFPISDRLYRIYLRSVAEMKETMSVSSVAEVMTALTGSHRFVIDFVMDREHGMVNDIRITMAASLLDYQESLQRSFDKLFTVEPSITVDVYMDFDKVYGQEVMERIVRETIGSNDFSVTFEAEEDSVVYVDFDITLGDSAAEHLDAVKEAVGSYFKGVPDYKISYKVGGSFDTEPKPEPEAPEDGGQEEEGTA